MIDLLLIPYMALMAGWSGGSIWGSKLFNKAAFLPEILFALGFGYALYPIIGFYALIPMAWSYIWMQTGHGNALNWGNRADHNKSHTLTPLIDWLADKLNIEIFSRAYSFLFFSVKGVLIFLPIGGIMGLLWPVAYDIGAWLQNKANWKNAHAHASSELLSGAFAGMAIWIFHLLIV